MFFSVSVQNKCDWTLTSYSINMKAYAKENNATVLYQSHYGTIIVNLWQIISEICRHIVYIDCVDVGVIIGPLLNAHAQWTDDSCLIDPLYSTPSPLSKHVFLHFIHLSVIKKICFVSHCFLFSSHNLYYGLKQRLLMNLMFYRQWRLQWSLPIHKCKWCHQQLWL